MSNIIRRDPFNEMISLRNTMDRFFENAFTGSWEGRGSWTSDLALDVVEKEDEYLVKASIPGIDPDDLEITFSNRTLTIRGEIKEDREEEGARYHLRERRYGNFSRSIMLGSGVDADKISANYEDGILTLHLPKKEEVKPKRIAITSGSSKVIEG